MSLLAVVAFPVWQSAEDGGKIEALRQAHDPEAARLPAHVTLVFPTEAQEAAVIGHVREVAAALPPITLRFTRILPYPDPLSGSTYAFLRPEAEADAAITTLHDRLYEGPLAAALRRDLPFVPHVTVGRFAAPSEAEGLRQEVALPARLVSLSVLRLAKSQAECIEEVFLG